MMANPGDKMKDGTIFVGCHPQTGEGIYVTENDAPMPLRWQKAVQYTQSISEGGHRDWRLPTDKEMDLMFRNHNKGALKGTFNETVGDNRGCYWSAMWDLEYPEYKIAKKFRDGIDIRYFKEALMSVRPVRTGPAPQ